MRLVIASDIHGSAMYCRRLLEAYDRENADKLIILGDILYHGPRNNLPDEYAPKSVISMLNERKAELLCVRGNCDTEVDQMVLEFPIMSEQALIYADGVRMILTHGHKLKGESKPVLVNGDILLCGHTHVPKAVRCLIDESDTSKGSYVYINPGSVSIPKEDSWHGYIVYDNGVFTMKNLEGTVQKVIMPASL